MESRIEQALQIAAEWTGIDGAHHKQWVIDQMVRALTGDGYAEWVHHYNNPGFDAEYDTWDEGIAP